MNHENIYSNIVSMIITSECLYVVPLIVGDISFSYAIAISCNTRVRHLETLHMRIVTRRAPCELNFILATPNGIQAKPATMCCLCKITKINE